MNLLVVFDILIVLFLNFDENILFNIIIVLNSS